MRVLLTGGAGFIGSQVARALRDAGHRLLLIDDLSSGVISNVPEGVDLKVLDIRDSSKLERVIREFDPELINHHAAIAGEGQAVANSETCIGVNVLGCLSLLRCAASSKARSLVFASSVSIYGNNPNATETSSPRPLGLYAYTKLSGELLMREFAVRSHLNCVILRYSNVYGPGQMLDPNAGVVMQFAKSMLLAHPPEVFGMATKTRDFIHVRDIARANQAVVELLAKQSASRVPASNHTYNIGSGVPVSLSELISRLRGIVGYGGEIRLGPARTGDIDASGIDIANCRRDLAFTPEIDLSNGLAETVEWIRTQLPTSRVKDLL